MSQVSAQLVDGHDPGLARTVVGALLAALAVAALLALGLGVVAWFAARAVVAVLA
jgi:hypothetical protein